MVNKSRAPTLGVVAISYNEERDLKGFIDHLLPWIDEIVIIDDGSSDRTAEIATTGAPKVNFIGSPRNDGEFFSHQRNKGIAASTCDWLLHMDIDERVTPELANEIITAVRDERKDAYRYRRLNYFLHRPMHGGGWQDWNLVHLAKRNILRFSGMYHEECIVDTPPERIGQLKEKMWHLNDESYKERMEKSFLYCQEQAAILTENGAKIRWWHLLLMPLTEFFVKLVKKRGYKDGTLGLLFALHSACAMFRACALVWDEQNRLNRSEIENQLRKMWTHTDNDFKQ
ncbi:MAG: glycosyltransferase family 2 protein [Desulfobacteraceae bacterium]|nr:glycosyltransferase family 2 protein [Desulfobacteraceae bacterium]MBC2757658.1 glycosyltransferase family 2 protein [Desulfobacteraceae bacterium]MBC2763903.1 glycosyltransferase family 2 protein [ANME-2 cluster archaeon]